MSDNQPNSRDLFANNINIEPAKSPRNNSIYSNKISICIINPLYEFQKKNGKIEPIESSYTNSSLDSQPSLEILTENVILPQEDRDICIICLEYLTNEQKIKPCNTCNIYMDKACFLKYIKNKKNNPVCVTCNKKLDMGIHDIPPNIQEIETPEIIESDCITFLEKTVLTEFMCMCICFISFSAIFIFIGFKI